MAIAEFTGDFEILYDQLGLMLRVDKTHWVKCGVEYFDRVTNYTTVVTQGVSDWSAVQLSQLVRSAVGSPDPQGQGHLCSLSRWQWQLAPDATRQF